MAFRTLVDSDTLARHLGEAAWRLFDCRHDLADPGLGERQYAEAHIPGARFAHLDRDLSARPDGRNGRHPLPEADAFAAWLGQQGLKPGDQVVAYDAGTGTMASRLWSMLRWIGHDAVAVLDGGFAKWRREGRPLGSDAPAATPTVYPGRPRAALQADAAFVAQRLGRQDILLLDARSPERFRGDAEPIDPIAGRIPGAHNRYCSDNLGADGCFESAEQLRREFAVQLAGRDPAEVVHYCGSGVAACHNQLAMEIAGLAGSRVYTGSWSEWIADPARPRLRGNS
ncbi:MAG: sulfurtransferase [Betaproteobacteria bacterium]|nr:sulfurtransferase [Betaproteobacteria bacterium]